MKIDLFHKGFDIEFKVDFDNQLSGSKKHHKYHVDGFVGDIKKFTGVACFDKKTNEYQCIEKIKDIYTRDWIIRNSIDICRRYENGVLTIRGLHYQLVGLGMINSQQHYKRVVGAMIQARWDGLVGFEQFSDRDREMVGETDYEKTSPESEAESTKKYISHWMEAYYKNRWENQEYYIEVFIEKKALEGVFASPCEDNDVALGACKGYPSLTFLKEASERFKKASRAGKECVIIYFGDYDPSGEDIPRSIQENMYNFNVNVEVDRIALMEEQVVEWGLPPAPAKLGDSRTANWGGLGQVELDAVDPEQLMELCQEAIDKYFDEEKHEELKQIESEERTEYRSQLKEFVKNMDL